MKYAFTYRQTLSTDHNYALLVTIGAAVFALLSAPVQAQTTATTQSIQAPINISNGRYVGVPSSSAPSKNPASQPAAAAPPPPPQLTFEQTIAAALIKRQRSKNGGLTNSETKALIKAYETPTPTLLWVTREGLTDAANSVIAELQNAPAYGLKASAYKIPKLKPADLQDKDLATAELILWQSVLRYARHAKGGRVRVGALRSQLTQAPKLTPPAQVLETLKNSTDPAQVLRNMHPSHPQFAKLREKLMQLRGGPEDKTRPKLPDGPVLRKGMTHDHVALLRTRLHISNATADPNVFDDDVEATVKAFQKSNATTTDGIVGPGTRRALNGNAGTNKKLIRKILINMERWRWLPQNLDGEAGLHVWVNIPGLRVRVIKNGQIPFSQKAIVGLVTHKTPVFSDSMEWIEIHPTWFVPNSIKVNDILPSLRRKTSTVMQRYNLKVNCGASGSNYKTIDWNKINISKCSFTQPAGPKSVLGDFKFKFPNKHSVYLHDTHKPELFNGKQRTYSHGCVRVKNPRSLAQILLENDSGMSKKQLDRIVDGPKTLRTKKLKHPVPVHITYFTALFDDEGNFVTRPDYYAHDSRLTVALLQGRGAHRTAATKKNATKNKTAKKKSKKQAPDWWQNLF